VPTLAAAEERWRLTIDNAPVGIALVGLEGQFLRVNAALCRSLGYTEAQLLDLDFQRLTHPEDLDADLSSLEQLVAGEITSYRMRKRYLHADGHHVWADLSVSLVRDTGGTPLHFVSHVADLTEEVKAAAKIEEFNRELSAQKALLERSNADLEAFAMLASHDLQAPLATIRGYVELLETRYVDVFDDRANEWVSRVSEAAARMSQLVNSLLDFSRVGGAHLREPVSVVALVEQVRRDPDRPRQSRRHRGPREAAAGPAEPDPERVEVPPSRAQPSLRGDGHRARPRLADRGHRQCPRHPRRAPRRHLLDVLARG
jgi:PAS domain S-box-containing protein